MEQIQQHQDEVEARNTMFMLGGVAMVIFGAGLILSNPIVRRFMGSAGLNGMNLLQSAVPNLKRYLRIRNM